MENLTEKSGDAWMIFIDGACEPNPGRGGYGWIIANVHGVTEGGGRERQTTNNRMELKAAISALEQLIGTPGPVTIYSDAEYVVLGITKWIIGWKKKNWTRKKKQPVLNRDLWEALDGLVTARQAVGDSVNWIHVHAHQGIAGNERVDEIANAFANDKEPNLKDVARADYPLDLDDLSSHPERASSEPKWQSFARSKMDSALFLYDH